MCWAWLLTNVFMCKLQKGACHPFTVPFFWQYLKLLIKLSDPKSKIKPNEK